MRQPGGAKTKKKKPLRGPEAEETLCCCEYLDRTGERSHLAACLCDCQDLDEGCERWLTCRSLPPGMLERIADTFTDRFRLPWLRGAVKIDISLLPPIILLPVFLHVAALHFLLALVILISLPVLVLWYYYLTHRKKGQTLFFLSLGLFSLGYMYYVFLQEVVPQGHVGYSQVILLTCGLILMLVALSQAKRDPGYLHCQISSDEVLCQVSSGNNNNILNRNGLESPNGLYRAAVSGDAVNSKTEGNTKMLAVGPGEDWCTNCQLVRPARAGHCRICGRCVKRLDHHCVWINTCVGEQNHQAFILALCLFLITSVYGISLTLDTICRGKSTIKALFHCPGVYGDYSSALSFTCVWYCAIVTAGMAYILLIQFFNISYNVTEREARIALRENIGRRLLCGLVVDTGQYNRGFLRNWIHFLTLRSAVLHHSDEDIV
ncbi:palmitoyltransferase ZDHHC23 [Anolis carolinensis]|uniref:Palmitoyltransferase n=1 Tax=Anolis carolinensis TaxID=28377 RepID=G1KV57_ANOCA|nr:PREDICTED: palmitoyltransferase ZDHHC23 [Anolis carolinensis]|eukprot:XP_003219252.1 PREDICTED: palmitoyltransferase ZDHHC23 [Anolis carolinensis]